MENIVCKSCGGSVTRKGNYYICDFCRSKWMIDSGNDVHAVERANAWEALRNNDFEKAAEQFENIILKNNNDHEGYWGRALALNGIIYVDDVREGKKVPTCNNITESSFLKDKDVQKAISIAPTEIKASYTAQAEQIEKIRAEWLNVARKEPPYDVFISFKDSDRERGIERTQDSIDAQDIYTGLVDAGYKVFYSRVSLRGKVSEQYEPYIYNAIKTAKVMIVFGEKPEYFNSTWIKNEWSRFRARIEKGEKHKNSLVVVVKDMNPSDLPVALKSRQAMNMADLTFFETLKKHIARVIEESNKGVHLDKIEVKGGQIAKKATKLEVNAVKTREIGAGATAQTDISELQTLSLADTYMKAGQWDEATKLVDDVLFNNPACVEALWKQILISKQVINNQALSKKLNTLTDKDLQYIDKILNCAGQDMASEILDMLYDSKEMLSDDSYCKILKAILPYQYANRESKIKEGFDWAIENSKKATFILLLSTLGNKEVNHYLKLNFSYLNSAKSNIEKKECLDRILNIDEGNVKALKTLLYIQLNENEQSKVVVKTFENVLKYSEDNRAEITEVLTWLGGNLNSEDDCELVKQILRYSADDISTWKDELIALADIMIRGGHFSQAEYICKLVLTFDPQNPTIYWDICLIKTHSKNESEIKNSPILLKGVPEYTKYLTLVDENRRQQCLALVKKQENALNSKKHAKKVGIISAILAGVVAIVVAVIVLFNSLIIPSNHYKDAISLINEGKYSQAEQILTELDGFKESNNKLNIIADIKKIEQGKYEEGIKQAINDGATVNITYDCAGGEIVQATRAIDNTFTYDKVNSFTNLKTSTRNGYAFEKWSLVSCEPNITENSNTISLSFTAEWETKAYVIEYDLDGGEIDGENVLGYNADDEDFTLINPTRTGYTFAGWTGTDLDGKTMLVTVSSGSWGNRSYTANWTPNTYKVTYNAGDGVASKEKDSFTFDSEITLASIIEEKDYYEFDGWYDGTNKIENGAWKIDRDITLTAKWKPIAYGITYNLDSGSATNPVAYTVENALSLNQPIKTGYTFDGWTGTGITGKTKVVEIPLGSYGAREYTAHWTVKTYTVKYNVKADETANKIEDTATYDSQYNMAIVSKTGYTFQGWYYNGQKYESGIWQTDSDVILEADWSANTYIITYDNVVENDENALTDYIYSESSSCEEEVVFDKSFTLSTVQRTGYSFLGWYNGTTKMESGKWTIDSDINLVASWKACENTITLNVDGGTITQQYSTTIPVTYDKEYTLPIPTKEGSVFAGWYNGTTQYTNGIWNGLEDITLTAIWQTPWDGSADYNWYYNNIGQSAYDLWRPEELASLSLLVENGISFQDVVISLRCDFDLGGKEWKPIGTDVSPFRGTLDGNGYAITNFKITGAQLYAGIFGYNVGCINNLELNTFTINVSSSSAYRSICYAGGLIAYNKGSIDNCCINGEIKSSSSSSAGGCYAGGLIGYNDSGTIKNSFATVTLNAVSNSDSTYSYAGGLIAYNKSGIINDSYVLGTVMATTNSNYSDINCYAGGLIAYNDSGTIKDSCAIGAVSTETVGGNGSASSTTSKSYAGGLVGYNKGNVDNCYVKVDITARSSWSTRTGSAYSYAGGLIGCNTSGMITNSCAIGETIYGYSYGHSYVGGLIGDNASATITNCYATGNVSANSIWNSTDKAGGSYAGGLIGDNGSGTIMDCYATGDVSSTSSRLGESKSYAGGLIAYNSSCVITNCYAIGEVKSSCNSTSSSGYNSNISCAGGLIGENNSGTISSCYATGGVKSISSFNSSSTSNGSYVGGLIGNNKTGGITNCYRSSSQIVSLIKNGSSSALPTNAFGLVINETQLQSITFLTKTLGWDSVIWNFTEGQYPTLKNCGVTV